jgi:hypothetical protein
MTEQLLRVVQDMGNWAVMQQVTVLKSLFIRKSCLEPKITLFHMSLLVSLRW